MKYHQAYSVVAVYQRALPPCPPAPLTRARRVRTQVPVSCLRSHQTRCSSELDASDSPGAAARSLPSSIGIFAARTSPGPDSKSAAGWPVIQKLRSQPPSPRPQSDSPPVSPPHERITPFDHDHQVARLSCGQLTAPRNSTTSPDHSRPKRCLLVHHHVVRSRRPPSPEAEPPLRRPPLPDHRCRLRTGQEGRRRHQGDGPERPIQGRPGPVARHLRRRARPRRRRQRRQGCRQRARQGRWPHGEIRRLRRAYVINPPFRRIGGGQESPGARGTP